MSILVAMGMWRVDHHNMADEEYRNQYFKNCAPDEPAEEWDDRNRPYAVKERNHVFGARAGHQGEGASVGGYVVLDSAVRRERTSISLCEDLMTKPVTSYFGGNRENSVSCM